MKTRSPLILLAIVTLILTSPSAQPGTDTTPQVLIEARIVEVHQDFSRELGVDWQFLYNTEGGQQTLEVATVAPGNETALGKWVPETVMLVTDSGIYKPTSQEIFYAALTSYNVSNIIASPRITTIQNQNTIYDSVTEASPKGSSAHDTNKGSSTSAYNVGDTGQVTLGEIEDPRYSQREMVQLYDHPRLSFNTATRPGFVRQDGMIQGLKSKFDLSKIPGLSDVPTIGFLFRTEVRNRDKGNLIIITTPLIINTTQD
ncbi:hypothetical protein ACFL5X_02650 [Candidatus Omnitrophota bacterium]